MMCSHVHLFTAFVSTTFLVFQIDYDAPLYPCFTHFTHFTQILWSVCKEKRKVNIRMEMTILEMLKDIEKRHSYLYKYWYTLWYFVHCLHTVYWLLFKVLSVFGNSSMASKLKCHNIQDGPRPIQQNLELFKELVVFTHIKIQMIGSIVWGKINLDFQDTLSQIFFWLTKFLNNIIWFDNRTDNVLHDWWPVQMHFLWLTEINK